MVVKPSNQIKTPSSRAVDVAQPNNVAPPCCVPDPHSRQEAGLDIKQLKKRCIAAPLLGIVYGSHATVK